MSHVDRRDAELRDARNALHAADEQIAQEHYLFAAGVLRQAVRALERAANYQACIDVAAAQVDA